MKVRLSKAADRDLGDIYLLGEEQFGVRRAESDIAGLRGAVRLVADYPLASRIRPDTQPPMRARLYESHVIIYVVDEAGVLILRFRHGHEDWLTDPIGGATEESQP